MSLIQLNHFDFSKLFYLATEPNYLFSHDHRLAVNPAHICSVTVAKYGTSSLTRRGEDGLTYVFLPVRISMVDGQIHEVCESYESVLDLIRSNDPKMWGKFNMGYTITHNNGELTSRAAA